ncbi:hypothetical protein [Planomonospora sp. ID82291]|uniref:hypothetical protein n=1 Tax=Planomonospora sp. ID82291 TaxID=2738136 RepID=UPI0018C3A576|nr:hypothetical protein [Planomonospora sp. ID82291]MBG0814224.1 hypothetical protein [Planomonospora sp. ID82291]
MRKSLSLLAASLLTAVLIPGTAGALAHPVRDTPELTGNSLYGSGKLTSSACSGGALSTESSADAKRTLHALWQCMNTSWSRHFARAGLRFEPARLVVLTKPARFCDSDWEKGTHSSYCAETKTAVVLVDKKYYLRTREIYHVQFVAGLHSRHLQELTGIAAAFDALPSGGKSELSEQYRRYSLQQDCLAGAFLGSVWKTVGRGGEGWPALLDLMKANGDEVREGRYNGKGKNIAHWLDRGFKSGDPGSCNTWKASSARVA